ncbi:MAG TPA: hypothetical protein VNT20_21495 [Flavisolibacter sp.]|nr:hypothetical protein [Flavisolibacter sp.]
MKLWRKNKKLKREIPSFLTAALARVNGRLISIANFLQQKTNNYSPKKKKLLLLLFVIAFLTESSNITIQSLTRKTKTSFTVTRIKPILIESDKTVAPVVTKTEFLRIQRFRNYIDSLSTTTQGKKLKESLLHSRPELMDSVNFLINLYLEQLKTSVK